MCLIMPIRFWRPSFNLSARCQRTARKHTAFTILLGNAKALAAVAARAVRPKRPGIIIRVRPADRLANAGSVESLYSRHTSSNDE
jgi:hypothetical protein